MAKGIERPSRDVQRIVPGASEWVRAVVDLEGEAFDVLRADDLMRAEGSSVNMMGPARRLYLDASDTEMVSRDGTLTFRRTPTLEDRIAALEKQK